MPFVSPCSSPLTGFVFGVAGKFGKLTLLKRANHAEIDKHRLDVNILPILVETHVCGQGSLPNLARES